MLCRMSVSKPITARDLEEFTQALEKNPLIKYQMESAALPFHTFLHFWFSLVNILYAESVSDG